MAAMLYKLQSKTDTSFRKTRKYLKRQLAKKQRRLSKDLDWTPCSMIRYTNGDGIS